MTTEGTSKSTSRRRFGRVRKLPSGRWQARYPGPDGKDRNAPDTFRTRTDANRFLAAVETDLGRGTWLDPASGAVTLGVYASAWLETRTVAGRPLRPRTRADYQRVLDGHIAPLAALPLSDITPQRVRVWNAEVGKSGPAMAALCYRVLHAILQTATDEGVYVVNPARLRGAGQARAAERPLLSVGDVEALADGMPEHLRALVLLGFWGALRLGELIALERRDLDLDTTTGRGLVRVERAQTEVGGLPLVGPPKADSMRTVNLPGAAVRALAAHLERSPAGLPTARVFVRLTGEPLRGWDVQRYWARARKAVDLPEARVHDLRHAGLTLAAQSGATLREVMRRAGHSSPDAAMRYQHAAEDRDRDLADRLEDTADARRPALRARGGHAEIVDLSRVTPGST